MQENEMKEKIDKDSLILIDTPGNKYIYLKHLISNARVPLHLKCVLNNSVSSFYINNISRK